jgi:hypothetical protein
MRVAPPFVRTSTPDVPASRQRVRPVSFRAGRRASAITRVQSSASGLRTRATVVSVSLNTRPTRLNVPVSARWMVTVASSGRPRESGFEYTVSIVVCTSVISRQNRQGRTAANVPRARPRTAGCWW